MHTVAAAISFGGENISRYVNRLKKLKQDSHIYHICKQAYLTHKEDSFNNNIDFGRYKIVSCYSIYSNTRNSNNINAKCNNKENFIYEIINIIEKDREEELRNIVGDFSVVIWDEKYKRAILIRDHFGAKPLYYTIDRGKYLIVSDDINIVRSVGNLSINFDDERIAEYLMVPVSENIKRTFFKDIKSVEPGCVECFSLNSKKSSKYYSLDKIDIQKGMSDDEYDYLFREVFRASVLDRVPEEGSLGAMLSGGMDSSSIVSQLCAVKGGANQQIDTYSAVYPTITKSDESSFINAVLQKFPELNPHVIEADKEDPLDVWNEMLRSYGQATSAANLHVNWRLYHWAAKNDNSVLLDGFDGDSTLSHGRGYLTELKHQGRWFKLVRELKAWADLRGRAWRPLVWKWLRGPLFGAIGLDKVARLRNAILKRGEQVKQRDTWKQYVAEGFEYRIKAVVEESSNKKPLTERDDHQLLMESHILLRTLELLSSVGRHAGINVRYPFFDHRLVEFCISLPPEQKIRHGWTRHILRRALRDILPTTIRQRSDKADVSWAFDSIFRANQLSLVRRLLNEKDHLIFDFIDRTFAHELAKGYLAGERSFTSASKDEDFMLWKTISLYLWFNTLDT